MWGVPNPADGTINVHLGRSPKDRRVTIAFPEGDIKACHHTLQNIESHALCIIGAMQSRNRAHASDTGAHEIPGHPLFNDEMYGGNTILRGTVFSKYRQFVENCFKIIPRQALHAKTLGFVHPATKRKLTI